MSFYTICTSLKRFVKDYLSTINWGLTVQVPFYRAMLRISGLRNDMNKRTTFYKERKINNRCFDFLSKLNINSSTNSEHK